MRAIRLTLVTPMSSGRRDGERRERCHGGLSEDPFNRRTPSHRGKLFYRLMQQAVNVEPVPWSEAAAPGTYHSPHMLRQLDSTG